MGLANIAPVSLDSGHPQNENKNFFKQYGIAFEFGMFSQAFLSIKIHHVKVFKNQFFCLVLGWGPFGDGKHQSIYNSNPRRRNTHIYIYTFFIYIYIYNITHIYIISLACMYIIIFAAFYLGLHVCIYLYTFIGTHS